MLASIHLDFYLQYYSSSIMSSWDLKAAQDLPDNLKLIFGKVLDNIEIIDRELKVQEKYRLSYIRTVVSQHFYPRIYVLINIQQAIGTTL